MSPVELGRLLKVIEDAMIEARGEEAGTKVAAAILGSYSVVPLAPLGAPPDWETPLIEHHPKPSFRHLYGCHCGNCPGEFPIQPRGHSWSCQCTACHTLKQRKRD